MNCAVLVGRLTKKPECRETNSGKKVLKFTLAVNRSKDISDFISCEAWNGTAEFIEKWFDKGSPIAVMGKIITGSYEKEDGTKVYTTDVRVDTANFIPKDKTERDESADSSDSYGDFNPSDTFQMATDDIPF